MKLKRLGIALTLVFVLGAVTAGSAFANERAHTKMVKTKAGLTAEKTSVLTEKQAMTIALTSPTAVLETEVGTTPLKLAAKQLECASCFLFNEEGAKGLSKVTLKAVAVVSPALCKVSGESVTIEFTEDFTYVAETVAVTRFEPVEGKTTLATIKLENGTGECPIAGSYPLKGAFFAEDGNATGVFATSQPFQTSAAINKELSGEETSGGLELGSKPATFTASAKHEAEGLYFGFE